MYPFIFNSAYSAENNDFISFYFTFRIIEFINIYSGYLEVRDAEIERRDSRLGLLAGRLFEVSDRALPVAEAIAHTYLSAVQQATGQVRMYDNEIAHARRLALAGFTAADGRAATLNTCDAALERRAGVPSLYDVAEAML